MKIDGEFHNNLCFANDIIIITCTETTQDLQHATRSQELSDESRQMGRKINIAKTKVMVVDNTSINVNNVPIESAAGYAHLGKHLYTF